MNANMSVAMDVEGLGLPQPDQIGIVVRDLDEAIVRYAPLFGPFRMANFNEYPASYRGAAPSFFDLRFAFGGIGDIEVELIQWVAGDTPHRDFIESGREGMHHLRFRVDSVDSWAEKLGALGYEVTWANRASPDIAFAYCERADDPMVLELLECPADAMPGA